MISTTTVGSYPKPDYVPITDWFTIEPNSNGPVAYTNEYALQLAAAGDDSETSFRRATAEIIGDQVDAGIDVVMDGEVRRENYIHYQCRHFGGFDFDNLTRHQIRGTMLPTIRSDVSFVDSPLVRDYEVAQALSPRPVKVTLPGPMTIIDSTVDAHYHDDRALGADLAAALNGQIGALVAAGCTQIQVDEPVMARKPEGALAHGIEQVGSCFSGVPDEVVRTVHICCGYPLHVDRNDYPKADAGAYAQLAPALDDAPVDQVSIEDAHRPNDLSALLPLFRRTTVILGVVAIARSRVETVDEIAERLIEAGRYLPRERLGAAPDCGLGFLGRDLARQKLKALGAAASRVNASA